MEILKGSYAFKSRRRNRRGSVTRRSDRSRFFGRQPLVEQLEQRLAFAYSVSIEEGKPSLDIADRQSSEYQLPTPVAETATAMVRLGRIEIENPEPPTPLAAAVTVSYTVGGLADLGDDYKLWFQPYPVSQFSIQEINDASDPLTIPQGSSGYGILYIEPSEDFSFEGDEPFYFQITDVDPDELSSETLNFDQDKDHVWAVITDLQPWENEIIDDEPEEPGDHLPDDHSDEDCGCGGLTASTKFAPLTGSGGALVDCGCAELVYWSKKDTDSAFTPKFGLSRFADAPSTVEVTWTIDGGLGSFTTNKEYFDYTDPWTAATKLSLTLQDRISSNLSNAPTGRKSWTVKLHYGDFNEEEEFVPRNAYGTSEPIYDVFGGTRLVVNRQQSPFGNGWGVKGLDRLHTAQSSDGILLEEGIGNALWFEKYSTVDDLTYYRRPMGKPDYGDLVETKAGGSTQYYEFKDKHGNTTRFKPNGFLDYRMDIQGNKTFYVESGGVYTWVKNKTNNKIELEYDTNGKLSAMKRMFDNETDVVGTTEFKVVEGFLALINVPGGTDGKTRQMSFEYEAPGTTGTAGYMKSMREHRILQNPEDYDLLTLITSVPSAHPKDRVREFDYYDDTKGLKEIKDNFDGSILKYEGMQPTRMRNSLFAEEFLEIDRLKEQDTNGLDIDPLIVASDPDGLKGFQEVRSDAAGQSILSTLYQTDHFGRYILGEDLLGRTVLCAAMTVSWSARARMVSMRRWIASSTRAIAITTSLARSLRAHRARSSRKKVGRTTRHITRSLSMSIQLAESPSTSSTSTQAVRTRSGKSSPSARLSAGMIVTLRSTTTSSPSTRTPRRLPRITTGRARLACLRAGSWNT